MVSDVWLSYFNLTCAVARMADFCVVCEFFRFELGLFSPGEHNESMLFFVWAGESCCNCYS